jgi:putative ABC transport system permease protein
MTLALSGVTIGLMAALLLTRLIRSLLFGVEATDPLTFVGISALLALIALLASYIPAQRAARIDPMVSLRCD